MQVDLNAQVALVTGGAQGIGRAIVEAHQGAIWVEEDAKGGSVFNVLLAAAPHPTSS